MSDQSAVPTPPWWSSNEARHAARDEARRVRRQERAGGRGKADAPPSREPVTPERIADAALAVIDAEGLDGLTVRRLAQELGVGTMTLYWYVQNKDEVLDLGPIGCWPASTSTGGDGVAACGSAGGHRRSGGGAPARRSGAVMVVAVRSAKWAGAHGPGVEGLSRRRIQRSRRGRRLLRGIQFRYGASALTDSRHRPIEAVGLRSQGLLPDGAPVHRRAAARSIPGSPGGRAADLHGQPRRSICLRDRLPDCRLRGAAFGRARPGRCRADPSHDAAVRRLEGQENGRGGSWNSAPARPYSRVSLQTEVRLLGRFQAARRASPRPCPSSPWSDANWSSMELALTSAMPRASAPGGGSCPRTGSARSSDPSPTRS